MHYFRIGLTISLAIGLASLSAAAQQATNLRDAIIANPQAAAIARGISHLGRIVNGEVVEIANNPWQVALVRGYVAEPTRSQFCGGSLIAPTWVLTAAHCVRNDIVREDPKRINIVAGTSQFFYGGERIEVAAIQVHPQNNRDTNDFDFALLRLSRPTIGGAGVAKAVDVVNAGAQVPDGMEAFVTGWGATAEGAPGSLDLLGAKVPVVSNSVCEHNYGDHGDITVSMMCAGRQEGGVDACQGDSGGPLTATIQGRTALIGVVSWGEGCARRLLFGVYARVTAARPCIASTTGGN